MTRKYKIILVENDEDEQLFMKEGIAATGLFELLTQASEGGALWNWMEAHPTQLPDVILSDLNMPGKNGYDVINEVKNTPRYAHIPVIITSTSALKTTISNCLSLGAAGFIEKPETFVNYAPFFKSLHHMIEEKQLINGSLSH